MVVSSSSFVYDFIVTFPRVLQLVVFVSWRDCGLIEHRDLDLLLLNFQTLTYYKKYVFKKKKLVGCQFSVVFSFFPRLSLFPFTPCPDTLVLLCTSISASLSVFFCFSICLCFSLSYTCRHMRMDTYTIICRNFF